MGDGSVERARRAASRRTRRADRRGRSRTARTGRRGCPSAALVVPSAAVVGLPSRPAPTVTLKPAGNWTADRRAGRPRVPNAQTGNGDERRPDPDRSRRRPPGSGSSKLSRTEVERPLPRRLREPDRDERRAVRAGHHRDADLGPVLGRPKAGRAGQDGEVRPIEHVARRDGLRRAVGRSLRSTVTWTRWCSGWTT